MKVWLNSHKVMIGFVVMICFSAFVLNQIWFYDWPLWWLWIDLFVSATILVWAQWDGIMLGIRESERLLFGRPLERIYWRDGKRPRWGLRQ